MQLGNMLNEGSARAGAKVVAIDGAGVFVPSNSCDCFFNERLSGLYKLKELKINQRTACSSSNKQKHDQVVDGSYSNALQ
jgi:hypothetical protein